MRDTKSLERLIARASALPEDAQAEFVDAMSDAIEHIESKHGIVYRLSDEERRGIERGLRDMREGRFASEEAVAEVFRRARTAGA
jgi:predicted transcriptional regulator